MRKAVKYLKLETSRPKTKGYLGRSKRNQSNLRNPSQKTTEVNLKKARLKDRNYKA